MGRTPVHGADSPRTEQGYANETGLTLWIVEGLRTGSHESMEALVPKPMFQGKLIPFGSVTLPVANPR